MKKDNILGIGLLAIAGAFLIMTLQLNKEARLYPLLNIFLLTFLTIIHLIRTNSKNHKDEDTTSLKIEKVKQFFVVLLGCFLYILLATVIGYTVTTFLYILSMLLFLTRKKKQSILIAIGFTLFIYVLFNIGLKVPLPKGFLI